MLTCLEAVEVSTASEHRGSPCRGSSHRRRWGWRWLQWTGLVGCVLACLARSEPESSEPTSHQTHSRSASQKYGPIRNGKTLELMPALTYLLKPTDPDVLVTTARDALHDDKQRWAAFEILVFQIRIWNTFCIWYLKYCKLSIWYFGNLNTFCQ